MRRKAVDKPKAGRRYRRALDAVEFDEFTSLRSSWGRNLSAVRQSLADRPLEAFLDLGGMGRISIRRAGKPRY